jgi:glucose-6-phosphate 1-dehydrogenase
MVVRLDPTTGIRLDLAARGADGEEPELLPLELDLAGYGGEGATPYEVLLHAALIGDSTRFGRQDGVEERWRIMQPLLDRPAPIQPYPPGTWGPAAAKDLTAEFGGWRGPWIAS